jgi:hypothetical protein
MTSAHVFSLRQVTVPEIYFVFFPPSLSSLYVVKKLVPPPIDPQTFSVYKTRVGFQKHKVKARLIYFDIMQLLMSLYILLINQVP